MNFLAALTLGVLGSMHCIGMCGPLVLAVPSNASRRWRFILERCMYTVGKAFTYGILGATLGFAGKNILMGIQQNVSIVLGVTILITVAVPFGIGSKIEKFSPLKYLYGVIKEKFSILMKKRGTFALVTMGMLNGLLPCGLVYTALLGATAVADIWQSAAFMMLFGLGTAPALIVVSMTGKIISGKYRSYLSRAIPVLSIALALILILRGLNLGIPLVSPKISTTTAHEKTMDCCKE